MFLLLPLAKKQRWFYEPVVDGKSPYWDAPLVHPVVAEPVRQVIVDGYLSAIIESNPNERGTTKQSKRRPIQLMSEREADEDAKHGEMLRWSPTMHYVTTGLPNALASLLIIFWLPTLTV